MLQEQLEAINKEIKWVTFVKCFLWAICRKTFILPWNKIVQDQRQQVKSRDKLRCTIVFQADPGGEGKHRAEGGRDRESG